MDLPDPDQLRAVLTAARDCGVTRLRIGDLEVEMAPATRKWIAEESHPVTEDPLDVIRRSVGAARDRRMPEDMLEVLAAGGRLVDVGSGDPTQGS